MKWKREMSERAKVILLWVMAAVLVIYILNWFLLHSKFDDAGPEITFDQELLEVSISVTEEELLSGVKAVDKKDGDVTDTIIIESMSKLLDNDQRIVTYAAFDGDNQVGKAERRIQYTDYTSPRFSLAEPIGGSAITADLTAMLSPLHANDGIDGDISDQIILVNTELQTMTLEAMQGVYEVQVTNSCGDMASLKLPIKMNLTEGSAKGFASIELEEYLIYCKVGDKISPKKYVSGVAAGGQKYGASDLQIDSQVDTSVPGVYTVTYTLDIEGASTSVDLIVVVEE